MVTRAIATPYIDERNIVWVDPEPIECSPPTPPPCPNELTKAVLEDILDRRVESDFGRGMLKVAVDAFVPQLGSPACEWVAAGTLFVWLFT
jgi:hypothetical protein